MYFCKDERQSPAAKAAAGPSGCTIYFTKSVYLLQEQIHSSLMGVPWQSPCRGLLRLSALMSLGAASIRVNVRANTDVRELCSPALRSA